MPYMLGVIQLSLLDPHRSLARDEGGGYRCWQGRLPRVTYSLTFTSRRDRPNGTCLLTNPLLAEVPEPPAVQRDSTG